MAFLKDTESYWKFISSSFGHEQSSELACTRILFVKVYLGVFKNELTN